MVHVLGRDEDRVCEEDLGVRHGLVREEDDEGRPLLMQYCAECEVDLWEARRSAVEGIVEYYVCEIRLV